MKRYLRMISILFAITALLSVSVFAAGGGAVDVDKDGNVVLQLDDAMNMKATTIRLTLKVDPEANAEVGFAFDTGKLASVKVTKFSYDKETHLLNIYIAGIDTKGSVLPELSSESGLAVGKICVTGSDGTNAVARVSLPDSPLEWIHSGSVSVNMKEEEIRFPNDEIQINEPQVTPEEEPKPTPDAGSYGSLLEELQKTVAHAKSHSREHFNSDEEFNALKAALVKAEAILAGTVIPTEDELQAAIDELELALGPHIHELPSGEVGGNQGGELEVPDTDPALPVVPDHGNPGETPGETPEETPGETPGSTEQSSENTDASGDVDSSEGSQGQPSDGSTADSSQPSDESTAGGSQPSDGSTADSGQPSDGSTASVSQPSEESPQTGDSSPLLLFVILASISAICLAGIFLIMKRR